MARPLLGDMLVEKGVITREQMDRALEIQKETGGLVGVILVSQGMVSEQTLIKFLALQAKGES